MKVLVLLLVSLTFSLASYELKRALAPAANWEDYPYAVLILGVGKSNSVQHLCSGSILNIDGKATHILTTAFCIQNKTDPDDPSAFLRFTVLVPSANGTVSLGDSSFVEYSPYQAIIHPQAGTSANFTFQSTSPDGAPVTINATIDLNDVGILRLLGLVNVSGVQPVELADAIPGNGTRVDLLGFGGPDFYSLHKTDSMMIIPSNEIVDDAPAPNNDILFFRDVVSPRNVSQAVEPGDEGGALLASIDGKVVQVGVAQGTWRVSSNTSGVITYASLGPAVAPQRDWITRVLSEQFVLPTSGNDTSSAGHTEISSVVFLTLFVIAIFY